MSETHGPIASAVVLPEAEEPPRSPPGPTKRRQSSISEGDSKRPRFEGDRRRSTQDDQASTSTATDAKKEDRRKSGQAEERRRGQRLFGALLGALNQTAPSKVQRRRADIEKKQQVKLRIQDEEYDEKKKKRLEELTVIRKREQIKLTEQSMRIRHSNLLAMAHFLHTQTEPRLYYKPWELVADEESRIKKQIEEAEETINQELKDFEATRKPQPETDLDETNGKPQETIEEAPEPQGKPAGSADSSLDQIDKTTSQGNGAAQPINEPKAVPTETTHASVSEQDAAKENGDDAGEVVLEAEEDTVIY